MPNILGPDGRPLGATPDSLATLNPNTCTHGLTFDEDAARALLAGWRPKSDVDFIMGNPASDEIKRRWPRGWFTAEKPCPLGCGFVGIAYVSAAHYAMGDW